MPPITIGLYCDREDWILGTIAKQIIRVHGNDGRFEFVVTSWQRIMESPIRQTNLLRQCDVIHWLEAESYMYFGSLFPNKSQICTINHCLPGDDRYPQNFEGVRVLTISKWSRDELLLRGFSDASVINTGIDESLFRPLDKDYCRSYLGIDSQRPMFGFFGKETSNPQDRKGVDTLVSAARLVAAKRPLAALISGEGWEKLTADLEQAGVEVFRRPVETLQEMSYLYGAIDLYLCTSRIEGGPVPVLEAMVCERPVISTPVGHVPELIQHGANGLIVPVSAPEAVADAIEGILSDDGLRRRLAQAGRKTILENWTWESVLEPLGSIYEQAAATSGAKKFRLQTTAKSYLTLLLKSFKHRVRAVIR